MQCTAAGMFVILLILLTADHQSDRDDSKAVRAWPVMFWVAGCFHHFFFFPPVNFQSFMLRACPLMHILTLLLTPELQGRSIYRTLCYALSLQHVVWLHSSGHELVGVLTGSRPVLTNRPTISYHYLDFSFSIIYSYVPDLYVHTVCSSATWIVCIHCTVSFGSSPW